MYMARRPAPMSLYLETLTLGGLTPPRGIIPESIFFGVFFIKGFGLEQISAQSITKLRSREWPRSLLAKAGERLDRVGEGPVLGNVTTGVLVHDVRHGVDKELDVL